jgi:hypothetical protein
MEFSLVFLMGVLWTFICIWNLQISWTCSSVLTCILNSKKYILIFNIEKHNSTLNCSSINYNIKMVALLLRVGLYELL